MSAGSMESYKFHQRDYTLQRCQEMRHVRMGSREILKPEDKPLRSRLRLGMRYEPLVRLI